MKASSGSNLSFLLLSDEIFARTIKLSLLCALIVISVFCLPLFTFVYLCLPRVEGIACLIV